MWVATKKKTKGAAKVSYKKKSTCPVCKEERYDLKLHLMAIHKLNEENALAFKSQQGMYKKRKLVGDSLIKTKRRVYQRRICPYMGCLKVKICFLVILYSLHNNITDNYNLETFL